MRTPVLAALLSSSIPLAATMNAQDLSCPPRPEAQKQAVAVFGFMNTTIALVTTLYGATIPTVQSGA
jgi:hypothetical protein